MSYVDPFANFGAPTTGTPQQGGVSNPFSAYTPPSHPAQQPAQQPAPSPLAAQLHPAVAQAATTPGMSLTPTQIGQLQSGANWQQVGQALQGFQPLSKGQTYPTSLGTGTTSGQSTAKGKPALSATQLQQQSLTQQWNQLANTSQLTLGQVSGPAGQSLAQQLAKIASQLPNSQATQLIKQLPTSLQSLVNNYVSNPPAPASTTQPKPFSDPLALQTMYKDVFAPAMKQADALSANTGSDYTSAMSDAIAGSHMSPSQAKQQMAEAKATGAMMQSNAGAQASAALGAIPYDTMISALSTAAAQSQLDREAQERAVAYGVGQTAASGAGQTGTAAGNTASQVANTLAALGLTGPSQ